MENKKKIYLIIFIFLILIVGVYFIFLANKKTEKKEVKQAMPTEEVIPTIDSSVKVSLTPLTQGKELELKIDNIPGGTSMIEYSLTYDTRQQNAQGVIGTASIGNSDKEYEKKITLGTCSSGRCVYHEVTGNVRLSLKFTGDYGEKIFEKEYSVN